MCNRFMKQFEKVMEHVACFECIVCHPDDVYCNKGVKVIMRTILVIINRNIRNIVIKH